MYHCESTGITNLVSLLFFLLGSFRRKKMGSVWDISSWFFLVSFLLASLYFFSEAVWVDSIIGACRLECMCDVLDFLFFVVSQYPLFYYLFQFLSLKSVFLYLDSLLIPFSFHSRRYIPLSLRQEAPLLISNFSTSLIPTPTLVFSDDFHSEP